jgi:N-acetylglucosaminyldiphosphoundecaprenol N-acetyl-beta-D-mannosaminyltransferase
VITGLASEHPRVLVRGTPVSVLDLRGAAEIVERVIFTREAGFICMANVHVVETARRNRELADALARASLVLPDGAPIAWRAGRLAGWPIPRIAGADLFEELCRRSITRGFRHFFVGSTPETLDLLCRHVSERYPGVEVAGTFSPPFRPFAAAGDDALAERLNTSGADIIWVGLGAPKQEVWMNAMRDALDAPILVGVGAVFDFVSSARRRAPRVLQRCGLEWAYRLAQEPRRLVRRYATTNVSFAVGIASDMAADRRQMRAS